MNKKIFVIFSILLGLISLTSCGNGQPQSLTEHINLVIKEESAKLKQQEYDELFSKKTKKDLAQCILEFAISTDSSKDVEERNEFYKTLSKYKASELDQNTLISFMHISNVLGANFYICAYGKDYFGVPSLQER